MCMCLPVLLHVISCVCVCVCVCVLVCYASIPSFMVEWPHQPLATHRLIQ